ncbi:MAG: TVP38/TMEM64 family protein [Pseudomonadota bacterium]
MTEVQVETAKPMWKRLLPLGVIGLALALFFAAGLHQYLSLETLASNQVKLQQLADENLPVAMLTVIVVYATLTAISVPGAAIMTLLSGLILGTVYGGISVVIGATIGATIIFLAGRSAAGDVLAKKGGDTVAKLEAGFRENALSYLFILRLVPLFPFWLVNLSAAAFQVPTRTYVMATFFGIMPGTFVYAAVGAGLGSITESSSVGADVLLQGKVIIPLVALVLLSLVPILVKRLKKDKGEQTS